MSEAKATYDVCLSYASKNGKYVKQVAKELHRLKIHCFYDKDKKSEMLGTNLRRELEDIYQNRGKFCVVFLSRDYAASRHANIELKSALARAFAETREYILPGRFDKAKIHGVPDEAVYEDLTVITPEEFASIIAQKVRALDQITVVPQKPPPPKPPWWRRVLDALSEIHSWVRVGSALLIAVTVWFRSCSPSHTTAEFAIADRNAIFLAVSNTGAKRSLLRPAVLDFGELGMIENESLVEADNAESVIIPPHSDRQIRIEIKGLTAITDAAQGTRFLFAQIKPALMKTTVTVWVEVEESNGKRDPLPIPVEGARIIDLVKKQLPSEEPL